MSNNIDPDFGEGHEVTWFELIKFLLLVIFMVTVAVMFIVSLGTLKTFLYIVLGVIGLLMAYSIYRFIKNEIFNR